MFTKVYFIFNLVIIILIIDSNDGQKINNEIKIVGGAVAQPNQIPYQVSLRIANQDYPFGNGHRCGGILISNNTILTAAHCVYGESATGVTYLLKPNQFKVVMGTNSRFNQTIAHLTYAVKSIHPHYNYSGSETVMNDIATLIIDGTVPNNHVSVRPIALASYQMPVNTSCTVSGFGALYADGPLSSQLMYAQISIVNTTQCNISYQNRIKEGMICAGIWTGGIDSCQGDSGGPLVCNNVLTGIVSWGNICAKPNYPGVYTDVYHYRNWIAENNSNLLANNLFIIFLNLILIYIFKYKV